MRIDFPFAYEVRATASRWKDPRNVILVDFIDFVVPEADSDQAPVCMEWTHEGAVGFRDRYETVRQVRRYQDGFYVPLAQKGRAVDHRKVVGVSSLPTRDSSDPRSMGALTELFPYLDIDPRIKALEEWYSYASFGSDLDGRKDVQVHSDTLERERAVALEAVSRLLVIDGTVYMRVPEPRLVLDSWLHPFPGHRVDVVFEPASYDGQQEPPTSPARRTFYRADDYASLEAELDNLAEAVVMTERDFAVYDGSLLTFDRTHDIATRAAAFVTASTEGILSEMGRRGGNAWYDLVEVVEAYAADGDRVSFGERVMSCLSTIRESLPSERAALAAEIARCVELWSSSEIGLVLGDGPSPGIG